MSSAVSGVAGPVVEGTRLEELQSGKHTQLLSSAVAPLQTSETKQLVGNSRLSDDMRLGSPHNSPSFNTLAIPRHNHLMASQGMERIEDKQLKETLKRNIAGVSDKSMGFMRTSLKFEEDMWNLVGNILSMTERVYTSLRSNEGA